LAILFVSLLVPTPAHAREAQVTIGTGGLVGVYYPLGNAICRLVNTNRREHGVRCRAETSGASVENINGVLAGRMDAGFAQSDSQYYALRGEGPWKGKPQPALRALFSVYPELFTLVARGDASIQRFEDLKGKRVNIGAAGSGTRATMDLVMKAFGFGAKDLKRATELGFMEMAPALCDNKIDAFVFVAGHPNAIVQEAANTCASHIAPVDGPAIDRLLQTHPYYAHADVPAKLYRGTDTAQPTFGVLATLVVREDMPEETAYTLTKAVFDNFDDFKRLHPAIYRISKKSSLEGNTAPFHPGAVRYFKEAGLM
jgi:hypothetical protein